MVILARRRVHPGFIVKLIERSPIVVTGFFRRTAARRHSPRDLPAGYDIVDVFILDWLAAETSRRRRRYLPL